MLKNPLIVALDTDDPLKALKISDEIGSWVGALKVGPRLVMREGSGFIRDLAKRAPVFVDMKHFDIPSTMCSALEASFEAGASFATVHALAGSEALKQCAELEMKFNQKRPFKILVVTLLTSFRDEDLPPVFKEGSIAQHVESLSNLVQDSRLTGVVCSGHELSKLQGRPFFKVVPGIRMSHEEAGDQKRVMGPREALQQGASAIVVGRPILDSDHRKKTVLEYLKALELE